MKHPLPKKVYDKMHKESAGESWLTWLESHEHTTVTELKFKYFYFRGTPAIKVTDVREPFLDSAITLSREFASDKQARFRRWLKRHLNGQEKAAFNALPKVQYVALTPEKEDIAHRLNMLPMDKEGERFWITSTKDLSESTFYKLSKKLLKDVQDDTVLKPGHIKQLFKKPIIDNKSLEASKSNKLVNQVYDAVGGKNVTGKELKKIVRRIGFKGNRLTGKNTYSGSGVMDDHHKQYVEKYVLSDRERDKLFKSIDLGDEAGAWHHAGQFREWLKNEFSKGGKHFGTKNEVGHVRYYEDFLHNGERALYVQEFQSDLRNALAKYLDKVLYGDNASEARELKKLITSYKEHLKDAEKNLKHRPDISVARKKDIEHNRIKLSRLENKKAKPLVAQINNWFDAATEGWHYDALEKLLRKAKKKGIKYFAITDSFTFGSNAKNQAPGQYNKYYVGTAKKLKLQKVKKEHMEKSVDVWRKDKIDSVAGVNDNIKKRQKEFLDNEIPNIKKAVKSELDIATTAIKNWIEERDEREREERISHEKESAVIKKKRDKYIEEQKKEGVEYTSEGHFTPFIANAMDHNEWFDAIPDKKLDEYIPSDWQQIHTRNGFGESHSHYGDYINDEAIEEMEENNIDWIYDVVNYSIEYAHWDQGLKDKYVKQYSKDHTLEDKNDFFNWFREQGLPELEKYEGDAYDQLWQDIKREGDMKTFYRTKESFKDDILDDYYNDYEVEYQEEHEMPTDLMPLDEFQSERVPREMSIRKSELKNKVENLINHPESFFPEEIQSHHAVPSAYRTDIDYWYGEIETALPKIISLHESNFYTYTKQKITDTHKDSLTAAELKRMLKPLENTPSHKLVTDFHKKIANRNLGTGSLKSLAYDVGHKGHYLNEPSSAEEWEDEAKIAPGKEYMISFKMSDKAKKEMLDQAKQPEYKEMVESWLAGFGTHTGESNELGHIRYIPKWEHEGEPAFLITEIQSDFRHSALRFARKIPYFKTDKIDHLENALAINKSAYKRISADADHKKKETYKVFINKSHFEYEKEYLDVNFENDGEVKVRLTALKNRIKTIEKEIAALQRLKKENRRLHKGEFIKWIDAHTLSWIYHALKQLATKAKSGGAKYMCLSHTFRSNADPSHDSPYQWKKYYVDVAEKLNLDLGEHEDIEYWVGSVDDFISKSGALHESNFYRNSMEAVKKVEGDRLSPKQLKRVLSKIVDSRMKNKLFDEVGGKTILKTELRKKLKAIGYRGNFLDIEKEYIQGHSPLKELDQKAVSFNFSEKIWAEMMAEDIPSHWSRYLRYFRSHLDSMPTKYIGHFRYFTNYEHKGKPVFYIQEIQSDLKNKVLKDEDDSFKGHSDKKDFLKWIGKYVRDWHTDALEQLLRRANKQGYKYFAIAQEFDH